MSYLPHYFVFLARLADDTFFVGISDSPEKAIAILNNGEGPEETRMLLPATLVYSEEFMNAKDAEERAMQIRRLRRPGKEKLARLFSETHGVSV